MEWSTKRPIGLLVRGARSVFSDVPFRGLLRGIRYLPQRLLHPLRRRKVSGEIEAAPPPSDVLFLCNGNICRSPYAVVAFERRLPSALARHVAVRSAGFLSPEGRPSPPEAVRVARRMGVELAEHRSRVVTRRDPRTDLIVVMDEQQRNRIRALWRSARAVRVVLLGDLDPSPIDTRAIVDPWGRSEEEFGRVYRRIDRCAGVLADLVAGGGGS